MANGKVILIVDDDPGARRLLQFVLSKTGCEIVMAASGKQALATAAGKTIHLLVTDVMMAGVDGFELTRTLRRTPDYAELPIIILSARGQAEHREEFENNAHTIMMTKPFSPIELTAQVQALLKL